MYTINTDKWTGKIEPWKVVGETWETDSEILAIKQLAYFRCAYPQDTFSLLKDGYILSSQEINALARHIILS